MIHFVRLKVIEASLINCLSKNFDRWLSSILFFSWHVEVIHKNNQFVTWYLWPIDTLSLFFKARLNVILYLIWCGSSWKYLLACFTFICRKFCNNFLDCGSLSRSSFTHKYGGERVMCQWLNQESVSDGVLCRYHNATKLKHVRAPIFIIIFRMLWSTLT